MTLISSQWREQALEVMATHLSANYGATELNPDDLVRIGLFGDFDRAWRIHVESGENLPQLILATGADFPAVPPRVVIEDAKNWYLRIPHIESDGCVCLFPNQTSSDQSNIGEVIDMVVVRAIQTIKDGISGANREDFVTEVESYWKPDPDQKHPPIFFIGALRPPSRIVYSVSVGRMVLVGDSEQQCTRWLENYYRRAKVRRHIERSLFLYAEAGIYPDSYFRSSGDLLHYMRAHHPNQLQHLASLVTRSNRHPKIFLGIETNNGTALLAGFLTWKGATAVPRASVHIPRPDPMDGFRDGTVSETAFACRFRDGKFSRTPVYRAYPEWVHSRGGGVGMTSLAEKSVVLLGAGSLGSEVAQLLCNAGLKKLTIVDGDVLSMDNIGRHLLGAREVGAKKAEALRKHLLGQFPHARIQSRTMTWETLMQEEEFPLFASDLIISLTGEWPSDSRLNAEVRARGGPLTIFGWTEPHGLAGHALLVAPRGGCATCGRNAFGEVTHRVTDWQQTQLQPIPACGGFYQPYGAVETGPIKSMIASLAIECLQAPPKYSELRSWLGNRIQIENLGGKITDEWLPNFQNPSTLGQIVSRKWPISEQCPQCREA
ncbi:MAG: ThiF family adenylyltransferase [Verrucomicrobiota bacterium]